MGGICSSPHCANQTKGRRKLCGGCMKKAAKEDPLPPNPGPIKLPWEDEDKLDLLTRPMVGSSEQAIKVEADVGSIAEVGSEANDRSIAEEPAWAQKVRDNLPAAGPVGPPPTELPADMAERLNLEKPFVVLTLRDHGQYIGPTRGRVLEESLSGFVFLTNNGLYFVPWGNLAYWDYLSEI